MAVHGAPFSVKSRGKGGASMAIYSLPEQDVVRVSGPDARKLLNDTLTCRFDEGLKGAGRWFALLSPQGKIQVEGLVTEAENAFWFTLPSELAADFVKRMKLYRLRAKVEIEAKPELGVFWSPDNLDAGHGRFAYRDERAGGLGTRAIRARDEPPAADDESGSTYHAARIGAGVAAFGEDFGVNDVFPHDVGMDFLGGVDFKKGCYVGQEVVSRMEHRGTARRRPVIVSGVPEGAAAGAPLIVGAREAGAIGRDVEGHAIAIVRLDRVTGEIPTIGGLPVELRLPAWAPYRFGEAPAEV
jgi:tRNA-modifying protein YgfZ